MKRENKRTELENQLIDTGIEVSSLHSQMLREYELGSQYIKTKIEQYEERIKKRNPQSKKRGKILNINMISEAISVAVSVSFSDALSVRFVSRDGFLHQEQADKLQYVAEFDNQEGNYQQIKYLSEMDRLFFGVSIRYMGGRENTKHLPDFSIIDPMTCIPDPYPTQTGKWSAENYRFMGFSMQTNIWDLINAKTDGGENLYLKGDLNSLISEYTEEQTKSRRAKDEARNYNQTTVDTLKSNFSLGVYYHFTIFDNKKILTVWDAKRTRLLRYVELEAVLQEEQENETLIKRPFVLTYRSPRRDDFFGESFCDILEDKQNAKSVLANLSIIKAQKEARGGRYIVNSKLIKNKDAVLSSRPYESFIFTTQDTEGENLNNAMVEMPQSTIKSDVFNMLQFVENEAKNATAQDELQRGIIPDKSMTKAEAQQAQANNNIRSLLNNTIASRGEKDFWFLWWRTYNEFFSQSDKKFIALQNNFEYSGEMFEKDEFLTGLNPYIMIGTRAELDSIDEQQAQTFTAQVIPQMNNPIISEVSKKMMMRHWFRLNKIKANLIYAFVPLDPTERKAKAFVEMINQEIEPQSIFSDPSADYQTYWIYLQKAKDNKLKRNILSAMSQILVEIGGPQQAQINNEVVNSASNIAMSQAMQGMNKGIQSRQNVLPDNK